MPIELGSKVRDKVTGITGICTMRALYLYGATRVEITYVADNKSCDLWVYEDQAEAVEEPDNA